MKDQGGAPGALWSRNARALLTLLAEHGTLARPDLTRLSGLSRTTVAQTVSELGDRGILAAVGTDATRRGPIATLYGLAPEWGSVLVVAVERDRTRAAVVSIAGDELGIAQAPTPPAGARTADLVAAIVDLARGLSSSTGPFSATFVGVPGVVAPGTQELSLAEAMPEAGRGFAAALGEALGVPVTLENDVNLAALAELAVGADADDFAYVSLGDGLGAAIVSDGALRPGARGGAGELSYLPGTNWEREGGLGAESIAFDAAACGLDARTPSAILELARDGHAGAREVLARTARRLALVVATLALVLDPEAVVLGGSVGSDPALLALTRDILRAEFAAADARLVPSYLDEDAPWQGAIITALRQLRERAFDEVCAHPPATAAASPERNQP